MKNALNSLCRWTPGASLAWTALGATLLLGLAACGPSESSSFAQKREPIVNLVRPLENTQGAVDIHNGSGVLVGQSMVLTAGHGDVSDARHDARGKRVQQELDRGRSFALAAEHRGMIAIGREGPRLLVPATGSGERFELGPAVGPGEPAVRRAKLKARELSLALDGFDRRKECRVFTPFNGIEAVRGEGYRLNVERDVD